MKIAVLAEHYMHWHYGQAFTDLYRVWMNIVWFFFNFFSITTLMSTLLQPWKRMDESYPRGFDPATFVQTLVVNILMRLVGLFVRLILVGIGLTLASITFLLGGFLILAWAVVPAGIVLLILTGLTLLISG